MYKMLSPGVSRSKDVECKYLKNKSAMGKEMGSKLCKLARNCESVKNWYVKKK